MEPSVRSEKAWRKALKQAVRDEDRAVLSKVLEEHARHPEWSLPEFEKGERDDFLKWMVGQGSAWGVDFLLERGHRVTPLVVDRFFNGLSGCWDLPNQARYRVEALWPCLLPGVLAAPDCRLQALLGFLKMPISEKMAPHVGWDSMGMGRLVQGFEAQPLRVEEWDAFLTPLQLAWLFDKPEPAMRLLGQAPDCRRWTEGTRLGAWTLEEALSLGEKCQKEGCSSSSLFFSKMVEAWDIPTEMLEEGPLENWMAAGHHGYQEEILERWRPVRSLLEASRLESALPASAAGVRLRL